MGGPFERALWLFVTTDKTVDPGLHALLETQWVRVCLGIMDQTCALCETLLSKVSHKARTVQASVEFLSPGLPAIELGVLFPGPQSSPAGTVASPHGLHLKVHARLPSPQDRHSSVELGLQPTV